MHVTSIYTRLNILKFTFAWHDTVFSRGGYTNIHPFTFSFYNTTQTFFQWMVGSFLPFLSSFFTPCLQWKWPWWYMKIGQKRHYSFHLAPNIHDLGTPSHLVTSLATLKTSSWKNQLEKQRDLKKTHTHTHWNKEIHTTRPNCLRSQLFESSSPDVRHMNE